MESRAISPQQISASSEFSLRHAARFGRLHLTANQGSWSAKASDANQWLQIDLTNQCTRVTRVTTQGRDSNDQWVTKYSLQYSNDTANFQYYREQGKNTSKVKTVVLLVVPSQQAISEMPKASVLKRGQVQNLSCVNDFLLSCK